MLHLHGSTVVPEALLDELAEVLDRAEFGDCSRGLLVVGDGGKGAEAGAQGQQFGELAHVVGVDTLHMVHDLVDGEIHEREVPEEPVSYQAVSLVLYENWLESFDPVELLLVEGAGVAIAAAHES